MKLLLILALTFSSSAVFAGPGDSTENSVVVDAVYSQICSDDALDALGVNGSADISFTVDAEGIVHVQAIQSNDFLLEYHVMNMIEGMKVSVTESIVGKTFSLIMNVVQPD